MQNDAIKNKRTGAVFQGSENEQRFKDIFNAALDGIFIIDAIEYCIVEANPKAVKLLGYDREELIGMHIEKIHPKEMMQLKNTIKDVILGNSVQTDEFSCLRKDKHRLPADMSFSSVHFDGKIYIMAMLRDITERKKAEEEIKSLAKFPSENPNPVLRVSKEGKIIYANEGSSPLLKASRCQIGQLLPDKWRNYVNDVFKSGKSKEIEVPCQDQIFLVMFAPVIESGYVCVYGRDITQLKRAQEALREALNEVNELKSRLQEENVYLQDEIKLVHNFTEIVTKSDVFKKVLGKVEQVASTDATVIILGETGTGKELIARAVHNISARRDRPLVKVNCAALPSNLIESELFGHEKGAFTGALERRIGRFELANGGTIFLDEIGDLPIDLQAKLLRVLQEGEFERLGGSVTIKVDVRVIAATNRKLDRLIESGNFREDLYYRLNVFPIQTIPLRERKEDIPLLVKHFVKKFSVKMGKPIETIPQKAMNDFEAYPWPGNVRELENIIERAVILSKDRTLRMDELLDVKRDKDAIITHPVTLKDIEHTHIMEALLACDWFIDGKRGAAKRLAIPSSTLRDRMRKYGISKPPRNTS